MDSRHLLLLADAADNFMYQDVHIFSTSTILYLISKGTEKGKIYKITHFY